MISSAEGQKKEKEREREREEGRKERRDGSHSDWCEIVSHCGFDLHFSDNE